MRKMNAKEKETAHHLPVSGEMEAVIKKHLSARFTEAEADAYWQKTLSQYETFLKDLPDFGGKKSRYNGPGGTYDCIALFAYYEVLK